MGLVDIKTKALAQAVIFQGGSNAGKSDMLNVMAGLFGPRSISVDLASLEGAHGLMPFTQRLPWVLHEAFDQSKWHFSSAVKALVTGEPVQINIKNGPMLSRCFGAPIFWGTNNPPQFREATEAITNRIIVIECRRRFSEDSPVGVAVRALASGHARPSDVVLATEMPGVLAWAVEGLIRARARGRFLLPEESREAARAVHRDSNIVAGFMGCIDFDPDSMVSVPDFSAAFASWWGAQKGGERNTPGSESISKALKALADPRIALDPMLRDTKRRYYAGIRLNVEGKGHWANMIAQESYTAQTRKAFTSAADEDPNRPLNVYWSAKPSIEAMRVAQYKWRKSMTVDDSSTSPMTVGGSMTDDSGVGLDDTY
jgi:hypothetical protein